MYVIDATITLGCYTGPVVRDWSGSRASRCQGEHDALTKRHRKARRRADYARGSGALAGEGNEGERGSPCVTKRSEACSATAKRGRSSRKDESENGARAGENVRGGARAPMATTALCAHGVRARERVGRSWRAQMVVGTEADASGRSWWPTRARPSRRMRATRRPSSTGPPQWHGAAVRAWTRRRRERGEGGERGMGRPGMLRWLGWLVGAGPPVNSPPFLF